MSNYQKWKPYVKKVHFKAIKHDNTLGGTGVLCSTASCNSLKTVTVIEVTCKKCLAGLAKQAGLVWGTLPEIISDKLKDMGVLGA